MGLHLPRKRSGGVHVFHSVFQRLPQEHDYFGHVRQPGRQLLAKRRVRGVYHKKGTGLNPAHLGADWNIR